MGKRAKKAGRIARRIGAGLLGRAKARAVPAGIGFAVAYAEEPARESLEFIKNKWWGESAILFGGSLMVKNEKVASSLATLAGYTGGKNYQLNEFQQGRREKSPVPQFEKEEKKAALPASTSTNTGLRQDADDASMLFDANVAN